MPDPLKAYAVARFEVDLSEATLASVSIAGPWLQAVQLATPDGALYSVTTRSGDRLEVTQLRQPVMPPQQGGAP